MKHCDLWFAERAFKILAVLCAILFGSTAPAQEAPKVAVIVDAGIQDVVSGPLQARLEEFRSQDRIGEAYFGVASYCDPAFVIQNMQDLTAQGYTGMVYVGFCSNASMLIDDGYGVPRVIWWLGGREVPSIPDNVVLFQFPRIDMSKIDRPWAAKEVFFFGTCDAPNLSEDPRAGPIGICVEAPPGQDWRTAAGVASLDVLISRLEATTDSISTPLGELSVEANRVKVPAESVLNVDHPDLADDSDLRWVTDLPGLQRWLTAFCPSCSGTGPTCGKDTCPTACNNSCDEKKCCKGNGMPQPDYP